MLIIFKKIFTNNSLLRHQLHDPKLALYTDDCKLDKPSAQQAAHVFDSIFFIPYGCQ